MLPGWLSAQAYHWDIQLESEGRFFATNSIQGTIPEMEGIKVWEEWENGRCRLWLETEQEVNLIQGSVQFALADRPEKMLANGFQSWSVTEEVDPEVRIKPVRRILRPFARYYGELPYLSKNSGRMQYGAHSWSWTYLWLPDNQMWSAVSMDEKFCFTQFSWMPKLNRIDVFRKYDGKPVRGRQLLFDIQVNEGDADTVMQQFKACFGKNPQPNVKGWTSWYNYYTDIDERIILDNLQNFAVDSLPITYFQIDDGYQEKTGDWLEVNEKFPNGMAYVADSIHECGYKAGIWLAPFVVSKKSKIFEEHPDWLVRDDRFRPVKVGYNPMWDGNYYAFNIYHPWARQHILYTLRTMTQEWGFDMVKADFLFAACARPYPGKTRAEIMTDAIALLREGVGDAQLLGCGTPLAPGAGVFDYCRIGPDIHLKWEYGILKKLRARERPTTWGALQNTLNRWYLDGTAFGNDPDVFILRDENQKLSKPQKDLLFDLNHLLGRLVFTSDDISKYNSHTETGFREAFPFPEKEIESVRPVGDEVVEIRFRILSEENTYLAYANLSDSKQSFQLPPGNWFSLDGVPNMFEAIKVWNLELEPYQLKVFRNWDPKAPAEVLGRGEALFPGAGIDRFEQMDEGGYELTFAPGVRGPKKCWIYVREGEQIIINGRKLLVKDSFGFRGTQYSDDNR